MKHLLSLWHRLTKPTPLPAPPRFREQPAHEYHFSLSPMHRDDTVKDYAA